MISVLLPAEAIYWSAYEQRWLTKPYYPARFLSDADLEEIVHHALGNLSGEQIKADGGSSAPAIVRAIRKAEQQ